MNPFPIEGESGFLTQSRQAVLLRVESKKRIVNQVIEGRLPLLEAAKQFGPLHGTFDHVSTCRTVIGWVTLALSERPEAADRVSDRLERELQCFLDRNVTTTTL